MLILALDTTTRGGSVAVTRDDHLLSLVNGDDSRTHGERLPGEIAAALEQAGVQRDTIDLLAVATGPGGFTGLRIGLATMQGLAMALSKPVAGVSALDALYAQVGPDESDVVVPWMDAHRGEVFAAVIDTRDDSVIEPPTAASPHALLDGWRPHLTGRSVVFIGDAVARDAALIADRGVIGRWTSRAPGPLAPQIASIARLRGVWGPPHALTPVYIRRPDAEIEREKRAALEPKD